MTGYHDKKLKMDVEFPFATAVQGPAEPPSKWSQICAEMDKRHDPDEDWGRRVGDYLLRHDDLKQKFEREMIATKTRPCSKEYAARVREDLLLKVP